MLSRRDGMISVRDRISDRNEMVSSRDGNISIRDAMKSDINRMST